ncbi:hypothetical protein CDL15_Pgr005511 [Punica granatum]|uniref:SUEL-type lectin domain-containing protein n=1 Tax=Punica granatum TaxID=22663 RepID=A0A218WUL2_PUNGR|nr:hypothetical protein CDL15_Pgr005511 [Punica granatum]
MWVPILSDGMPVGLKGEALSLHSLSGSSSVEWAHGSLVARRQPLTWYKTVVNAPAGNTPLALDMGSMGKGTYREKKCLSNCGEASQRWYHVPRSWLNPTANLLVVFEEWGGDPNGISLVRRDIVSVCADIYEWQPTLINYEMQTSGKVKKHSHPKAHLSCSPGQKISKVKSASFGTPQGACGSFREESCHAFHSYDVFQKEIGFPKNQLFDLLVLY